MTRFNQLKRTSPKGGRTTFRREGEKKKKLVSSEWAHLLAAELPVEKISQETRVLQ